MVATAEAHADAAAANEPLSHLTDRAWSQKKYGLLTPPVWRQCTAVAIKAAEFYPMISFASEGVTWASRTITWSFVDVTAPAGGSSPFTSGLDAAEQATVRGAVAQWAAASGLTLVELPAGGAASADISIGFGALSGAAVGPQASSDGGGEVGETDWRDANGHLQPGVVIRFEDPALQPLVDGTGTLTYAGTQTTLYQVALHEFGHALGLAHSADPSAVMNEDLGPMNDGLDANDVDGITWLYPATVRVTARPGGADAADPTTLAVPGGGTVSLPGAALEGLAATLLAPSLDGTTPITWVEPGAGVSPGEPALPPGQLGLLASAASGMVALGDGYVGVVALDTARAASLVVSGGRADGQAIIGGQTDIAVIAGLGGGSLVGGNGNDSFRAAPGGDPWQVVLGDGRDTVVTSGRDTVMTSVGEPGLGHAALFLGAGATLVVAGGLDTVVAGAGVDTVFTTGDALVYGGTGALMLVEQAAATLVGGAGRATVFGAAADGDVVYGGSGSTEFVGATGRASVIGGSGALTVFAGTGGGMVVAGQGPAEVYAGTGMLVQAGQGDSTITGAAGVRVALAGDGSAEVALGGGPETIDASAAGGSNALFAGSGADVVLAGAGHDTLFAGSGAATRTGGGGTVFDFAAAVAPGSTVINDFSFGHDQLLLAGFGAAANAAVTQSAVQGAAGLMLTLPNGSTVLLAGVHSLANGLFG